jgi:hypothetical protein
MLELAEEFPSDDEPAVQRAIDKEEQAILWKALERVPELYREPLVLYYREQRSVEQVAASLDLSEDAVKQRLARGRKILQERVLSFVESALSRSTPGRVFTLGVLAALPELSTPAKAAGIGAAAAQGGLVAKSTSMVAVLFSISGVVSAVLTLRANLDQSRTPKERRLIVCSTAAFFFGGISILGTQYLLRMAANHWKQAGEPLAWLSMGVLLVFVVAWPVALLRVMRRARVLRSSERRAHPELFRASRDQIGSAEGQYRSRWTLFGVPLIHIRYSSPDEGEPPVWGWIAGGDRAFGLVFAWGGLAVAPISVGAIAIGIFSVGTLSVGVISVGTAGVGLIALGCMALGLNAYGWLSAVGWNTAQGSGFAIAHIAADAPVAIAEHVNDLRAHQLLPQPNGDGLWFMVLTFVTLVSLGLVVYYAKAVRQRFGRRV